MTLITVDVFTAVFLVVVVPLVVQFWQLPVAVDVAAAIVAVTAENGAIAVSAVAAAFVADSAIVATVAFVVAAAFVAPAGSCARAYVAGSAVFSEHVGPFFLRRPAFAAVFVVARL